MAKPVELLIVAIELSELVQTPPEVVFVYWIVFCGHRMVVFANFRISLLPELATYKLPKASNFMPTGLLIPESENRECAIRGNFEYFAVKITPGI